MSPALVRRAVVFSAPAGLALVWLAGCFFQRPIEVDPADPNLTKKLGITDQDWRELQQLAKLENGYVISSVDRMGSGSIAIDFSDPSNHSKHPPGHGDIYTKSDAGWQMTAQAFSQVSDESEGADVSPQDILGLQITMTEAQSAVMQRQKALSLFASNFEDVAGIRRTPIPAGQFLMGSPDHEAGRHTNEGPLTRVTLTKDFWLGAAVVTQAQWKAVTAGNPSAHRGSSLPVEMVSWDDAMAFCHKLNEKYATHLPDGYGFTLPSEAQWEYACRAGTTGPQAGEIKAMAWYAENSGGETHPVGTKQANAWGLFDMHGNVAEWCADWYGNYPGGSVTDPTGPASGGTISNRVFRGGGSVNVATDCRSASRGFSPADYMYRELGFRVALVANPLR